MIKSNLFAVYAVVFSLLVSGLVGCAREIDTNEAIARANDSNLKRLSNLYLAYQMKHNWNGPKNEKVFKDFLNSFNPEKLQRIGVDPGAIDGLFVSTRDGEPFKIRYSVKGSAMGSSEPVVFETTGVEGVRMVGSLDMVAREVDDAEYDQLWAGKGVVSESSRE